MKTTPQSSFVCPGLMSCVSRRELKVVSEVDGMYGHFPRNHLFYRSKVSKAPVWKLSGTTPMIQEVIVKFEDDEDDQGRTPHRRVPSRYVIPIPSQYFYEECDDVELTPQSITK
ncbi:Sin3 binding region of histone deacetylase complex subunit SAP30 [Fragilaria crotonensis]|nr:Sin3 binding region of histone deacetylase complex subunit SAP30 [Fragilaria crotonensis]